MADDCTGKMWTCPVQTGKERRAIVRESGCQRGPCRLRVAGVTALREQADVVSEVVC